jgi:hypothetical protein
MEDAEKTKLVVMSLEGYSGAQSSKIAESEMNAVTQLITIIVITSNLVSQWMMNAVLMDMKNVLMTGNGMAVKFKNAQSIVAMSLMFGAM